MKNQDRRRFIKNTLLTGLDTSLGLPMVYASNFPKELVPIGVQNFEAIKGLPGKSDQLTVLNDRPVNAETPAHLLDDALTPNNLFFVRNNGIPPRNIDIDKWTLRIEGESAKSSRSFSLQELKTKFKQYTYQITLECGGNGRSEFNPPAKGNQWSTGAVGCATWTGVRLSLIHI